uniref:Uncharacterized protein n=1 Tax=Romanomermis culicivorax TaxID=13658 RepID=A0A915L4X7_ROMCU
MAIIQAKLRPTHCHKADAALDLGEAVLVGGNCVAIFDRLRSSRLVLDNDLTSFEFAPAFRSIEKALKKKRIESAIPYRKSLNGSNDQHRCQIRDRFVCTKIKSSVGFYRLVIWLLHRYCSFDVE